MLSRMMKNTESRWTSWMNRARTCCRAASAIDASQAVVHATVDAAAQADEAELVRLLKEAESALAMARDAVQAALQARQLTPANREVSYGLAV